MNSRFHIPELDGVRFLAFLCVLVAHTVPAPLNPSGGGLGDHVRWWISNAVLSGAFGLDLFFVLSGFLITSLLLREQDQRRRIDVRAFWIRRILRIWPLYYPFVLGCWALEGLPGDVVATFLLFCGNWGVLAFAPPGDSGIVHLWSVSIEEQFYFVWPMLLAWLPRRSLRPVCLGLIAAALLLRVIILVAGGGLAHVWVNTIARLDPIAVGALIALDHHDRPVALASRTRAILGAGAPLVIVATMALLTHALVTRGFAGLSDGGSVPIRDGLPLAMVTSLAFLVVALCCGAIVLVAIAGRSWLGHPTLGRLGRLSYGLYVFHRVAINQIGAWWWPWRLVLSFGIALTLASLSYRILERPCLLLKARFAHVPTNR